MTSIREIGTIRYLDNKMSFPTDEEFTRRMQSQAHKPAIKWRDLTAGQIYRIDEVKSVTTNYGQGTVLQLTRRDASTVEAWASARLTKDLGWGDLPRYIRPLGLVPCRSDNTKTYHKYELLSKQ